MRAGMTLGTELVAVLAIVGALVLAWVGFQPPNEKVLYVGVALAVVMVVYWFAIERNRFQGPPTGERKRQLILPLRRSRPS